MEGLDLRVRNVYTGMLDASIKLRNSLLAPVVGGDLRFSRGVASMIPPATSGGSSSTAASVGASEVGAGDRKRSDSDLLRRAFTVLTNSTDSRLARQLARLDTLRTEGSEDSLPAVENVMLKGVKIHLGPELRAIYPVVVNLGISGDVEVCGPANPNLLRLNGTINLDGGEINLVATQLVVEREQPNRLVFSPEQGLNPFVELNLKGMELRAHLACRASDWQKHLQITPIKAGSGEAAEQLDAAEVARIFEGQLESALLAEDGQLALSNLAASAAHGFMPRIQTQGQLGQARWRLVSAPSIPGLLSLDPSGDPSSLLSSLTMGTEVEVQFGKSLQAAMARKLRESDIATQWTLNYQINSKVRMQFNISSMSPYPRTWSSSTPPNPLQFLIPDSYLPHIPPPPWGAVAALFLIPVYRYTQVRDPCSYVQVRNPYRYVPVRNPCRYVQVRNPYRCVQVRSPCRYVQVRNPYRCVQVRSPCRYVQVRNPYRCVQVRSPCRYVQVRNPYRCVQVRSPCRYVQVRNPYRCVQVRSPCRYVQVRNPYRCVQVRSPCRYVQVHDPLRYLQVCNC
eukprot:jgi/Botrbrau1/11290/Bobra.0038s0056.1